MGGFFISKAVIIITFLSVLGGAHSKEVWSVKYFTIVRPDEAVTEQKFSESVTVKTHEYGTIHFERPEGTTKKQFEDGLKEFVDGLSEYDVYYTEGSVRYDHSKVQLVFLCDLLSVWVENWLEQHRAELEPQRVD